MFDPFVVKVGVGGKVSRFTRNRFFFRRPFAQIYHLATLATKRAERAFCRPFHRFLTMRTFYIKNFIAHGFSLAPIVSIFGAILTLFAVDYLDFHENPDHC